MRKVLRALFIVLALGFTMAVTAYFIYDLTQFQPNRDRIAALIASASPQEQKPSPEVVGLLRISLGESTAAYAARLLSNELDALPRPYSMLHWHLHGMLWWSLVSLHLSEAEQVTVVLALAPTGHGRHGVANTAKVLYEASLSELSQEQVATIIALTRSPSAADRPERLERSRDWLLQKYRAQVQAH